MTSRNGTGYFDVRVKGQVIGFVVPPSNDGGKWHAYMDYEQKAGSTRVGSYDTKAEAVAAVQNAAWG